MLATARRRIREKTDPRRLPEGKVLELLYHMKWEMEDRNKTTDFGKWCVWWTKCGKYRVVRNINELDPDESSFVACMGKTEVISRHKNLMRAFEACRLKHIETFQLQDDDVANNSLAMVREAEELGLDILHSSKESEPIPSQTSLNDEGDTRGKKRYSIFGLPVTAILRWMGKEDWTPEQAKQALAKEGIVVAKTTLQSQLHGGKVGRRGPPAKLTKEQRKTLESYVG